MERGLHGVVGNRVTGAVTDAHGNTLLDTSVASDGSAGLGYGERRFLAAGVRHGDFVFAPLSASGEVGTDNPLPNWTRTDVSGTAIHCYSIMDTANASQRVVRFDVASGASSDEMYLEQTVEVNGSRGRNFAYAIKCYFLAATTSTANLSVRVTGQFLKKDLTTTDSAVTVNTAFSALGSAGDIVVRVPSSYGPAPSDAYFLRMRVGIVRTSGTTDTGAIDLTEIRVITGTDELLIVDSTTPANRAGSLTKAAGTVTLSGDGSSPSTTPFVSLAANIASLGSPAAAAPASVDVEATRGVTVRLTGATGGYFTVTGGAMILVPGAQTVSAATDTLTALLGSYLDITVSGGPFTMTSAPTIANGIDGQELTLVNVSGNAITIQDQGTLANSNLRLSTTTFALSNRDSIKLRYSSTILDWIEVARTNVL